METLTLTQKEQARLQVLNSLLAEHMTLDQAATLMGVSARHTRRILAAYRREGAAALAHGNRGQKWFRKSEQGDKWNRCLIEGMIVLSETGARDEQTTPP